MSNLYGSVSRELLRDPHRRFFRNSPYEVRREAYRAAPRLTLAITIVMIVWVLAGWWFIAGDDRKPDWAK